VLERFRSDASCRAGPVLYDDRLPTDSLIPSSEVGRAARGHRNEDSDGARQGAGGAAEQGALSAHPLAKTQLDALVNESARVCEQLADLLQQWDEGKSPPGSQLGH